MKGLLEYALDHENLAVLRDQSGKEPISMAKARSASPTLPLPPPRVTVDEFTEAVFNGVLRAVQAQSAIRKPGPIIYGIIYMPEAGQLQVQPGVAAGAQKAE